jgi:SAM-dependent methyltransferase
MDAARHYAHLVDPGSQTSPHLVRRALVAALAQHHLGEPILDLGTGVGGNVALLQEHGRAIGVDISVSALSEARQLAPVVAADAAALPFASTTFGGALCTEVLEHVDAPAAVFAEMHRVLRPGAVAVVTTPNYSNPVGLHKLIADRRSGRHDYNPWGAHEGGYEAFMTGRKLWRAAQPHFSLLSVRAVDYGQALTGRFALTDRIALHPRVYPWLERLVPWLEQPHPALGFLAWHGMHVLLILRRR